jgi:hypothetical protein
MDSETFLTPEEVAARYKNAVSTKTLSNWRSAGTGPKFTKVGGKVLYALSDLAAWESERTRSETNPA